MMQQHAQRKGRAGFSLLEMLVAVTVLVVIVLITSMVFQQTQIAWTAGSRRAAAETALRGMMGLLERDLTHAVDATQFGQNQNFSSSKFQFVTLDGTTRMAQQVVYNFDGVNLTRNTQQITYSGSAWTLQGASTNSVLNEGFVVSDFSVMLYDTSGNLWTSTTSAMTNLPSRVEMTSELTFSMPYVSVSGFSYGPPNKTNIVVNP